MYTPTQPEDEPREAGSIDRTDIRTLDGHESWKGVCQLFDVNPAIDADAVDAATFTAATRSDRSRRYRVKHVMGVST
jgi:hypothetical protein